MSEFNLGVKVSSFKKNPKSKIKIPKSKFRHQKCRKS